MRLTILAVVAIATATIAGSARAQTYDPNYPVCLQVFGPINYFECRYSSLGQCAGSASGRGAQCVVNPYFANAYQQPPGRHYRRHHRAY
jgi:hypothetical protein